MWGIFWVFVFGFAVYDGSRDWANSKGLDHTFRAFFRIAFIVLISYLDYNSDPEYTAGAFKLAAYRFAWFWIVFDLSVNLVQFRREIMKGKIGRLFHLGTTAFLDWVFRAIWGVHVLSPMEKQTLKPQIIAATVSQYIIKILLLSITYHWYYYTSDTYLF